MATRAQRRCSEDGRKGKGHRDAGEGSSSARSKGLPDFPLVHKAVKAHESSNENLQWTIGNGKTTYLWFHCAALADPALDPPASVVHMTYKFVQTETKLLAALLNNHGLREIDHSVSDYNLLWTGIHMKAHQLQGLLPHQRVNHFPRSYELTRKDRLYKNIEKVQRLKGSKHFDFVPQTFVLPADYRELCSTHHRTKGPWIVKPVASSRGRGIYIVNTPDQIPSEETLVVAKYIDDPLLVGGHKCDLRLYIAVTSYDPLIIYLYEEGLVRLATVKYESSGQHLWNPCMHLCNYSINKYHEDYVKSEDPEAEDVGHKWTLSALLRHLRVEGNDTSLLMQRIEEIIVKAILAAAPTVVAASRFIPHPNNCFELYGFDILIDTSLKPWLLEVNLSPSLGCDSPLDVRVKSAMLADLLTLVGLPVVDPILRNPVVPLVELTPKSSRRIHSAEGKRSAKLSSSPISLTPEEARMVRCARAEFSRRGGFVRIFPSPESWKRYGSFLDPVTGLLNLGNQGATPQVNPHNYNLLLHQQLFPDLDMSPTDRLPRYERALVQGHRSSIFITTCNNTADKENTIDYHGSKELKLEVCRCLESGGQLTTNQARRAFAQYLQQILARLGPSTVEGPNSPSELCLKFLQKAAGNLRATFAVKVPSTKLLGKDRVAVIAKQLSEYLHLYTKETEVFYTEGAGPMLVPETLFLTFMQAAGESDLEEVLSLHTRLYKCAHVYLGRCSPPPASLKAQGLLQCLPYLCSLPYSKVNDCCYREVTSRTLPRLPSENKYSYRSSHTSRSQTRT